MPTNTAFLGMKTYSAVTDGSSLFSTFRADLAGVSATSNMGLLDTFASSTSASLIILNAKSYIIPVDGIYDSANTYLATVVDDIASYSTDLVIVLNLDVTSNGTVTLNINSLGAKSLQKVDDTGSLENLTNHDLQEGREYLFKYNGSSFVWMNSTSSDQISIAGNDGEVTFISGSGIITSGSTLDSFASSSEKYIVSELSGVLSNELLITAGSGMLLDNDTSSSKVIINSNFIAGSGITLTNDISASSITVVSNFIAGSGITLTNDISASSITVVSNFIAGSGITLTNDISASSITVVSNITAGSGMLLDDYVISADFASSSQVNSGSSLITIISPSALSQSNYGISTVDVQLNDATALSGTESCYIRIPLKIDGFSLINVAASSGSSTSGSPQFDVYSGSTTMLSTKITIDQGETDSSTATTQPVIDSGEKIVSTGDRIKISTDETNFGTDVIGAVVELNFKLEGV